MIYKLNSQAIVHKLIPGQMYRLVFKDSNIDYIVEYMKWQNADYFVGPNRPALRLKIILRNNNLHSANIGDELTWYICNDGSYLQELDNEG